MTYDSGDYPTVQAKALEASWIHELWGKRAA